MTYHSTSGRAQEKTSPDEDALAQVLMFVMGAAMITCVTAKSGLGPVGAMLGAVAARVIPRITTGSGQIMMITGAAVPTLVADALKQLEQRLQALKNALMTPNAYFPYSIFADQIFKQIPDELPPLYDGPYPDTPDYLGEAYDSVADFLRGLGATLSETDKKPLEKPGSFRNGEIVGDAIIAILSLLSATGDEAAKYSPLASAFGTYNSGGSGGLGGSSLSLDGSGALSAPSFVGGGLSIPYIDLLQRKALQSAYKAMSDIAKPQEATSSQGGKGESKAVDDSVSDKTKPSSSYNKNNKPRGKSTKVTDKMDEATKRSLTRENEAAETLAKHGYNVEQNPNIPQTTRNPDYLIEGRLFDCYSPAGNTKVRNVASTIQEKVVEKGQADRVVLNLDDWNGNVDELVKQLQSYPIEGLKEVITVKNGIVSWVYP